jgi:tetratricopeptide (TPR) repeat protein
MRATMLAEAGAWRQVAPLLDALGGLRPNSRAYLLLRVRASLEGTRNREDAERWARKALSTFPGDLEIALAAAEVLATGSQEDLAEARTLAALVLAARPNDSRALHTVLSASAKLEDWADAAARADAIKAAGLALRDNASAFEAYLREGRLADAAVVAEAWLASAPGNETAILALLRVRVLRGERAAAAELAAKALASGGSARFRSTVFFLQSRTLVADEAILSSLRSALVEDASNVEALTALYDYYARKADLDKARFYLKQALSLAPGDPDLAKRREDLAARGVATP